MPRLTPGAKKTDLAPQVNAARQSGFLSRIGTAVRYAIAGVQPDTWMSPSQPIQPTAPESAGRQLDYRVGYNLLYTPRAEELTSFQQLRALADNSDLVRLAIETRKDQMAAMQWAIVHTDPSKDSSNNPRATALETMLKRPDGIHGWQPWLRMLLEEVLVTDAPAIYPRKRLNGQTMSFELIDGATVKVLTDADGRRPQPPSPAYQQVLKGLPTSDYTSEELIYMPRNPRVSKFYGYSPVEQIILTVNIALRRSYSQLQYYTEGNIPEALASVPKDWTPQQISEFQMYWDTVIESNQEFKRKMRFVPGETKVSVLKEAPLKDEFDEWLARVICYAFALPPTQFVKQATRMTGDVLQEAALQEGLAPLKIWVKDMLDYLIQYTLGLNDLQFKWIEEESLDPQSQAVILTTYQKAGIYSINEIRSKLGEDPITDEGGDAYLIFTGSGAMTLDDVMEPPPAPPVGVIAPAANGEVQPAPGADPNAPPPKVGKKPPAKKPPADDKLAAKHDHGDLHKAAEPMTPAEKKLADSFAAALDVVRQDAIKQAFPLGKAAPVDDGSRSYTPDQIATLSSEFATAMDLSGLTLAWDDYSDTLQAVADDGARTEVARIVADDPTVQPAATGAGFDIFDHQDPNAVAWGREHAAEMLSSDGSGGKLADATRNMIRELLANALAENEPEETIAELLRDAYAFSPQRAELIARTEVRNAQGNGGLIGAKAVGMKVKKWLLSNDEGPCSLCESNAAQGWVAIGKAYISGATAPLQHPNCRCGQAYRRQAPEE